MCPKCRGACWIRPEGRGAAYSKQPCNLCFNDNERCSTGFVDPKIAREYYAAHPNAPQPISESPTKVPCPRCQNCPECRGSHLVVPTRASEIRAELKRRNSTG